MATNKTLTSYIRSLDDEKLNSLFEYIIAEMNRRKAKKQNVDVGFWNSDGVYIEDIQKINEFDEWAELKNDEIASCSDSDLLVWLDSQNGNPIPEFNKDEFLRKLQDLALNYGFDFSCCSTIRGMYKKLKDLDKDGVFESELETKEVV